MIPPTDSLEVALRAVPCVICGADGAVRHREHDWSPRLPTLAAAARKWARERIPSGVTITLAVDRREARAYNAALTDVAKALGLEDTP